MRIPAVFLAMTLVVVSVSAQEPAMTNQDVMEMAKARVNDHIVIASIKAAAVKSFDTSPAGLAQLKQAKVSDSVIAFMQAPSAIPPQSSGKGSVESSAVQPPQSFPWRLLIVQCSGAFIGAICAFGFALWLTHRQRRDAATAAKIDEFSSAEMLRSRFVTAQIARQVEQGEIHLRDVALSAVQGCPPGFVGKTIGDLTEHQHMSHLIGWIRRLSVQLEHRWVSRTIIAKALGGSLQWSMPFLLNLSAEAESVMKEFPNDLPPTVRASWVYAVRYLDAQLKKAEFHKRPPGKA
jgi:hypothetical protein